MQPTRTARVTMRHGTCVALLACLLGRTARSTSSAACSTALAHECRPVALRRLTRFPSLPAAHTHHTLVDSSLNGVVLLDVDLRQLVALDAGGLLDITQGRRLNDVANDEALDGFVLRDSLARRDAAHTVDVATPLLVTSVAAALDSHSARDAEGEQVRVAWKGRLYARDG